MKKLQKNSSCKTKFPTLIISKFKIPTESFPLSKSITITKHKWPKLLEKYSVINQHIKLPCKFLESSTKIKFKNTISSRFKVIKKYEPQTIINESLQKIQPRLLDLLTNMDYWTTNENTNRQNTFSCSGFAINTKTTASKLPNKIPKKRNVKTVGVMTLQLKND